MVALSDLAKQCETASRISCRFCCDPPIHLEEPGTAVNLYRIAQEAVHNAQRHSRAAEISIELQRVGDNLEIVVTDDGRGMPEVPGTHTGMGLASIRQRARLMGGDCLVQRGTGGGTVVRCWVPFAGQQARLRGPKRATSGREG